MCLTNARKASQLAGSQGFRGLSYPGESDSDTQIGTLKLKVKGSWAMVHGADPACQATRLFHTPVIRQGRFFVFSVGATEELSATDELCASATNNALMPEESTVVATVRHALWLPVWHMVPATLAQSRAPP
jgi:hypothetical protein